MCEGSLAEPNSSGKRTLSFTEKMALLTAHVPSQVLPSEDDFIDPNEQHKLTPQCPTHPNTSGLLKAIINFC